MRAVGFRVKSGFAVAIVLDGSRGRPEAVARHVVELSDPKAAETRQPYHHGFYTTEADAREIARRVRIVTRCANRSVAALIDELRETASSRSVRAALVVGSVIDPSRVGNPHIRAHASEGRLFRIVLEEALRSHSVECDVIVEKQLPARATADLGRSSRSVLTTLAAFGKALGSPWRADEKAAATAAWLSLDES
jgi:hypothetical protein